MLSRDLREKANNLSRTLDSIEASQDYTFITISYKQHSCGIIPVDTTIYVKAINELVAAGRKEVVLLNKQADDLSKKEDPKQILENDFTNYIIASADAIKRKDFSMAHYNLNQAALLKPGNELIKQKLEQLQELIILS